MSISSDKTFDKYFSLDKNHFWLKSQILMVEDFLKTLKPPDNIKKPILVDFGCGSANFLNQINDRYSTIGFDIALDELKNIYIKGFTRLACSDLRFIPLKNNTIDFFIVTDVLEHIEDETVCIKELNRILKPNGYGIITVPAFMCLWGHHDDIYGHKRRYTINSLKAVLINNGLNISYISYYKFIPFIPLYILRKIKLLFKINADDFWNMPAFLNKIFIWVISIEKYFLKKYSLPLGTGIVCIVKKGTN